MGFWTVYFGIYGGGSGTTTAEDYVTTRFVLLGSSQKRLTLLGTSQQRIIVSGSSR